MKGPLTQIRWLWLILGALAVEVVLFVLVIPLYGLPNGKLVVMYAVLPLCVITAFLGGFWVARKAGRQFLLHGLLLGALAAAIYAGIAWKATLPLIYVLSNYLKLLAGAAGGLAAQQRLAKTRVASP
jgi:putative membrane protein (TIGR04086 family)